MSQFADLHIHTHFSDSTQSPEEVIAMALENGVNCISITDHDTIDGIQPTMDAAQIYDIEVIPGIELSSEINGNDVHMLGYFFDHKDQAFAKKISMMQNSRIGRMERMIEKLKTLGIDNITSEEVCALAESKSVGRPHLATVLVQKGWVSNNQEAFDKYLADDAPACEPKFKQTPAEAITLIKEAGGLAVLAHPMLTKVDELIPEFVEAGMGGIEVFYPNTNEKVRDYYVNIAQKHSLLLTGGSDAHGAVKKYTHVGKVKISYELVEKMKEACAA